MNASSVGSPSGVGSIGTACGCTVRSVVAAWRRAIRGVASPADARDLGAGVREPPRRSSPRRAGRAGRPRAPSPRCRAPSRSRSRPSRPAFRRARRSPPRPPAARTRRTPRRPRRGASRRRSLRAPRSATGRHKRSRHARPPRRRTTGRARSPARTGQDLRHLRARGRPGRSHDPDLLSTSTTRGAEAVPRPGPRPAPLPLGTTSRSISSRADGRSGERASRVALRAQPSRGPTRCNGQAEPSFTLTTAGRQDVDVACAADVLLHRTDPPSTVSALSPRRSATERVRDADADLVAPGVRRLRCRTSRDRTRRSRPQLADRVDDRRDRRLRSHSSSPGDEVDGAVGADCHRVAELLLRLGRPEREHDGLRRRSPRRAAPPSSTPHSSCGLIVKPR